jgi:hypothetical protein
VQPFSTAKRLTLTDECQIAIEVLFLEAWENPPEVLGVQIIDGVEIAA